MNATQVSRKRKRNASISEATKQSIIHEYISGYFYAEESLSSAICIKQLDLYWLHKSRKENVPLHHRFLSMYITDALLLHRICFMDPILSSTAINSVVKETMVRTLNVGKETG